MTTVNESEFQQRMSQVEHLIDQIEAIPDASTRELSRRLTQALLDLHEVGFQRMLNLLSEEENSPAIPDVWLNDPLVSNLLVLHRLHPLDVQTRVAKAISELQPLLDKHQLQLEMVSLTDQQVELHLSAGCQGCSSTEHVIRKAIDHAICASAPELQVTITSRESAIEENDPLPILNQGGTWRQ